jgi:hypothetical protein
MYIYLMTISGIFYLPKNDQPVYSAPTYTETTVSPTILFRPTGILSFTRVFSVQFAVI